MSNNKHISAQDRLFAAPLGKIEDFSFDEKVANVFDDMVVRSVPFYRETQLLTTKLCQRLGQRDTSVYDLGCATGESLVQIARSLSEPTIRLVGVDNSAAMIDQAAIKLAAFRGLRSKVELICDDITSVTLAPASVVILNFTLQFLKPEKRPALLQTIYRSLVPGGILILAEKVLAEDSALQELLVELHHDFKSDNGYSELEISQKRDALESVLIPWSTSQNIVALRQAGFGAVEIALKWLNFATIVAQRE